MKCSKVNILFCCAMAIFVCGCASPKAVMHRADLSPDQIVKLKVVVDKEDWQPSAFKRKLSVYTVDEQRVMPSWTWPPNPKPPETLFLDPGLHFVALSFQCGTILAHKDLAFVGIPGKSYCAKVKMIGYDIYFGIVDSNTGRVVSE